MNLKLILLFLVFFPIFGGVSTPVDPLEERQMVDLPFTTQTGEHQLSTYVAQTNDEKSQGLMYVEGLPKDHGMIFVYEEMSQPLFWMKNMQMTLDFIYLDDEGVVVDLLENIPPCREENDNDCERYRPNAPSQYIIEVPEGWVQEVRLNVGDQFGLENLR